MNKKAENTMSGIGIFMGIFVLVIVGIALFQASAQNIGEASDLTAIANQSIAAVVNDTAQFLTNMRSLSSIVVMNATGTRIITAANYTFTNNVINEGALSVRIVPDADVDHQNAWRISGTAQPLTYIDDSGARSVASLIIIFFALAIGVVALVPVLRSGVMNMVGK